MYQEVVVFTLLFESVGLGCGFGPLTRQFIPPIDIFLYLLQPKKIQHTTWQGKISLTSGDTCISVDVVLYVTVLLGGICALLLLGQGGIGLTTAGDIGLITFVLVMPIIVALMLFGLRDKTVFLAARGEHYWLKLFVFFFPFTAFKLIMLVLWCGAAVSKQAVEPDQARALHWPGQRPVLFPVTEVDGPCRRHHRRISGSGDSVFGCRW
ncbi:DUF3556 domain-containing protein [Mycobacterium uberis]|uniref:DUF3556 domain-containing protein n=1 Tax=Mycobacterium uberis TaxID=2162698 RepID=UPI002436A24E|nr:DUF3556 domain-containing protein [Mycobacterium uberis]